ncbi:MAG: DNA-binding protein [Anaerocolumna sp.]
MNNMAAFITVAEIKNVLGVSESKAYRIVRSLNSELNEDGFLVLPGRVSRQYFNERFYGLQTMEGGEEDGSL